MTMIELAGRHFPVVGLICPQEDGPERSEWDRSLLDPEIHWLPAENGLIFGVAPRNGLYELWLYSPACSLDNWPSECSHWTPTAVHLLDPFGGSGTTAMVATGHGRDCISIDLDERNADLARERVASR